jgi:hypothetical protein
MQLTSHDKNSMIVVSDDPNFIIETQPIPYLQSDMEDAAVQILLDAKIHKDRDTEIRVVLEFDSVEIMALLEGILGCMPISMFRNVSDRMVEYARILLANEE